MPSSVAAISSIGGGGGDGGLTGRGSIGETLLDVGTLGLTSGKRAAAAQGEIAQAQLAQQRQDRDLALKYAEATPEELAQINRSIALNEADIERKEKLLASSDPALIEAGTQALKLLRGEESKTLAPLNSNIAKQEQALREKLRAQLGPGYENTTAGIQALQAFGEQANNSRSSAQQNALGLLLGSASDTSSRYGNQSNISNAGSLSQLFGGINARKVSAINSTPITGAGAGFVGDLQSARASTDFINNIMQTGAAVAGAQSKSPTGA
jgi:hypothetical protein